VGRGRCEGDTGALDRDVEERRRGPTDDRLPAAREVDRECPAPRGQNGDPVLDVEPRGARNRDRPLTARRREVVGVESSRPQDDELAGVERDRVDTAGVDGSEAPDVGGPYVDGSVRRAVATTLP
jgi:hypothetical protein